MFLLNIFWPSRFFPGCHRKRAHVRASFAFEGRLVDSVKGFIKFVSGRTPASGDIRPRPGGYFRKFYSRLGRVGWFQKEANHRS